MILIDLSTPAHHGGLCRRDEGRECGEWVCRRCDRLVGDCFGSDSGPITDDTGATWDGMDLCDDCWSEFQPRAETHA